MGEKGVKGFSLPKSSLKVNPAREALRGNDGTIPKSKLGRKVHFTSEGDGVKGGKVGKSENGKKSSGPKESEPLELRVERDLPKNAKCVLDCEAAEMLKRIQEQMVALSEDPTIKIPISFDRGLQYAKTSNHYTNPQSVRQVLDTLTKYDVSDGEVLSEPLLFSLKDIIQQLINFFLQICVIANICPQTVDEVFALVPSLKAKKTKLMEPIKDVLGKLDKLKNPN